MNGKFDLNRLVDSYEARLERRLGKKRAKDRIIIIRKFLEWCTKLGHPLNEDAIEKFITAKNLRRRETITHYRKTLRNFIRHVKEICEGRNLS